MNQLFFFPGSEKSNPAIRTWRNKLDKRSVDFLICDARTMRPMVAIELDDRTHEQPRRRKRDEEVEAVFAKARLKLVRIPVKRAYSLEELARQVDLMANSNDPATPLPSPQGGEPTPPPVKAASSN